MKNFFFAALFMLLVWSCDQVDDPIPDSLGTSIENSGGTEFIIDPLLNINDSLALDSFITQTNWDSVIAPDNSTRRFITLEEFTGHQCQFCPRGTREIKRLQGIYGDQLIPVAIHAGGFAAVETSGAKYRTDFTLEGDPGDVYLNTFSVDAYPRGTVSRLSTEANSNNEWSNDIETIEGDDPSATLRMINYFDSTSSVIRSNLEIEWQQTLSDDYNIQVYVIESKIVDWQKDADNVPVDIPNYVHDFVLRKVVNSVFGKPLKPAIEGDLETIQYIFPFTEYLEPNNFKNLEVVAFIFNSDPTGREVIQANSAHVVSK